MYKKRIEKVRNYLLEMDLDAALFMDPNNLYYLTGFTGSSAYLFVSKDNIYMLTDVRYTAQVEHECDNVKHFEYNASNPHFIIMNTFGFDKVGFEEAFLSHNMAQGLKTMMPNCEFVNFSSKIGSIRAIKDQIELDYIREAARIASKSFDELIKYIKVGMTEKDVASYLFSRIIDNGGDHHINFDIIVGSGFRSAFSHCVATEKQLCDGDFVIIDFGVRYKRYNCDMTRTIVIGKASDKQKEIYNHVYNAQKLVLDNLKAKMTNAESHRISNDYFKEHGYYDYCGNTLGHSLGLSVEDGIVLIDLVQFFGETILESNMVLTIEPGIYIPGFGGVRIEDDVIIKEDGIEIITTSPKQLIEII